MLWSVLVQKSLQSLSPNLFALATGDLGSRVSQSINLAVSLCSTGAEGVQNPSNLCQFPTVTEEKFSILVTGTKL